MVKKLKYWLAALGIIGIAYAATPTLCQTVPVETPSGRYLYFSNWEWDSAEETWYPPHTSSLLGVIDLRTLPQMGTKATALGNGIFVYNTPVDIKGGCYLGKDLNRQFTLLERVELQNKFGLSEIPTSDTILTFLWDLLGKYSDPKGLTGAKPIMPDTRLKRDMHLGGFSIIKSEDFDINTSPDKDKVIAVLQENYRTIRNENAGYLGGRNQTHKRYLDILELQYGKNYQTFIPADLPDEGKIPHASTENDTFTDTASTALDAHTSDSGSTWTEVDPTDWIISVNNLLNSTDTVESMARMDDPLSTSDMVVDIDMISSGVGGCLGSIARASTDGAGGQDGYAGCIDPDNNNIGLFTYIDGVRASIGSFPAFTDSLPDTHRLEANGSTIKNIINGSELQSVTNTSITVGVRGGVAARRNLDTGDNYFAEDIVVAAASPTGRRQEIPVIIWNSDD